MLRVIKKQIPCYYISHIDIKANLIIAKEKNNFEMSNMLEIRN